MKFASEDFVCCISGQSGADKHHIHTQKARPDLIEETWNTIPIAHVFHEMWHKKGMKYMSKNFWQIGQWLLQHGWVYDSWLEKWTHPGAVEGTTPQKLRGLKKAL